MALGRLAVAAIVLTGSVVLATIPAWAVGSPELISRQGDADGGAVAEEGGDQASISADGRFVAFASGADNLSSDDPEDPGALFGITDIFVRDTRSGTTTLVSRSSAADGNLAADGESRMPVISADGGFVAFASEATNLSPEDIDRSRTPAGDRFLISDIFVRNLETGETILASRAGGPRGKGGTDGSNGPSLSANGRYVAFFSKARNLSINDEPFFGPDVFVRDLRIGRTVFVSRQSAGAGGEGASGPSGDPSISANGRFVAFASHATNLSRFDREPDKDIYLRDLTRRRTVLISRGSGMGDASDPAIAAGGRYVAFVWERRSRTRDDDDPPRDLFVRDLERGRTTLVSLRGGGVLARGTDAIAPAISSNGRYVAFASQEPDPRGEDDDLDADVVLRDLRTRRMILVVGSLTNNGVESTNPALSSAARWLAYEQEPNAELGRTETRHVFRIRPFD